MDIFVWAHLLPNFFGKASLIAVEYDAGGTSACFNTSLRLQPDASSQPETAPGCSNL
jgi:hypothetical protein